MFIINEFEDINSRAVWNKLFLELHKESDGLGYTCTEARKTEHKTLNRYCDVSPYDHTRVVLKRGDVSYINANLVKVEEVDRSYILTQGPLSHTVGHFWLMVWEQGSSSVLMLNKLTEKCVVKCHMYWPAAEGPGNAMVMDNVGLSLELLRQENCNYYIVRTFKLQDISSGDSREITQFHYTTWPDFGVPSSPHAFLGFLKRVRASGALRPEAGPPVVHCSAGIGRSGTFCLVDSCLLMAERGETNINVKEILLKMRHYRMGLVQTADQLRFAYMAIIEGIKRLDPDWDGKVEEDATMEEQEEQPPPPPRRFGSLAPHNPLPREPLDDSDSDSSDTESDMEFEFELKPYDDAERVPLNPYSSNDERKVNGDPHKNEKNSYTYIIVFASAIFFGAIAIFYKYYY